jgi:hypothetical protein
MTTTEPTADGHTPENCPNMAEVEGRFADGTTRMKRIEDSIMEVKTTLAANEVSTLAHRRKSEAGLQEVHNKLAESEKQTAEHRVRLEAKVDANVAATSELLEIISLGKGFFRGIGFIGKWLRLILLWVLPLATAVMAFWYTIKGQGTK